MKYKWFYKTPENFSDIYLTSDGEFLTGLFFEGSKMISFDSNIEEKSLPIFEETCRWLDIYFSGKSPNFTPAFKIENLTAFRKLVIDIMLKIPFGKTFSYQEIADKIAKEKRIPKMSARAVGNAVGSNLICIIIPCHRVIGSNQKIVGYSGGIPNKIELLKLEKVIF